MTRHRNRDGDVVIGSPPNKVATEFNKAKPMLHKMLPSSLQHDKTLEVICEILQPYLDENWEMALLLLIYKRIDELPETALNHLAYQFHVDFYDINFSLEKKRAVVKQSIAWHKHKGTPWAVENMLTTMFGNAGLTEWYEYDGRPYYFKIHILEGENPIVLDKNFYEALQTIKNTRSWLDDVTIIAAKALALKTQYGDVKFPVPVCGERKCGTLREDKILGTRHTAELGIKIGLGQHRDYYGYTNGGHKAGELRADKEEEFIYMQDLKSEAAYTFTEDDHD